MKTYNVTLEVYASKTIRIKATNEDEAEETARDILNPPSLCSQCADEIELGDDYGDVLEVTEVTNAKD